MSNNTEFIVEMRNITKTFGTFTALDNVDLKVKKGTIHSILGENGAGKTTLMNILYGLCTPTSGEILINGKVIDIKNPTVAIENNIGMVHQHFMLVDNFSIIQNILLGDEITNRFGVMNYSKGKKKVQEIIDKYGLEVDPDEIIENVSLGTQQKVEIIKALYRGAEILILDEPTAVLTPQEIDGFLKIMHKLLDDGKTIIIITHKLDEIKKTANCCSIYRHGKFIDTVDVCNVSEDDLATLMVGREVCLNQDKAPAVFGEEIFKIEDITVLNEKGLKAVKDLSLTIKKGEILGIAGIDGNGQKELVEAITNLKVVESGKIIMNNVEIQNTTPLNTIEIKFRQFMPIVKKLD